MNFFSKLVAGAVAASSVAFPLDVSANSHWNAHVELAKTIEEAGIDFQLNPPECNRESNTYGWYYAAGKQLVVCQVNVKHHDWNEVPWTAEDLDTLRHEAHHLVQDCMDGELQGRLNTVYEDWDDLAKQELGYVTIGHILETYSDLPQLRQVMEIEAFAVAEMNDPVEQVSDIRRYCL